MRTIIGLAFILLAYGEYIKLEDLKSSEFGKSVLNAIELSVKSDNTDVTIKVLSGFKQSLNEQGRDAEDKLSTLKAECDDAINQYLSYVASAKIDLSKARNSLEEWQKPLDQWSALLSQRNKELNMIQANSVDIESYKKDDLENQEKLLEEYNQAISACDDAINCLNSQTPGTFLQSPVMLQVDSQIQSMAVASPANVPLFKVLIELGKNAKDQKTLARSIALLENLRDHIKNSKFEFQESNKLAKSAYDEYFQALDEEAIKLKKDVEDFTLEVQDWKAKVKDAKSAYDEATRRITDIPKLIEQKQGMCDSEKSMHEKDIQETSSQSEIIDRVLWLINNKLDEVQGFFSKV
ncbi:unnamed protein product [Blepharisma stoltei]|uniref:Uncharacterized protein n=1 Tax=Blepharisma stoltei TaxID=1481888 RepID=A0AAU9JEF8_9CILI|nr:unnamed protein product [Blepharisma stoltei]